jgi:AsmA protein
MQIMRPKARHYFAALAVAICGTLGLAAPFVLDLGTNELKLGGVTVFAAPRDVYEATEPLYIRNLPGLVLERGTIILADERPAGSGQPPSSGQATRLIIEGGVLSLSSANLFPLSHPSGGELAPLAEALTSPGLETLVLRRCTLKIQMPDGSTEVLYDVASDLSFTKKTSVTARGEGRLRGQTLSFEVNTYNPPDRKPGLLVPLRVRLKSPVLEASFDGRLDTTEGTQLQGQAEISIGSLRQMARWLGASWPSGAGLRNVKIKGELDWQSAGLAFDKALFQMDGNEAAGTLALSFSEARPAVTGTLALKSLDITSYVFGAPQQASSLLSLTGAGPLAMPLSKYFDADVRISAGRLVVGSAEATRFAATLTLKDGRLLADVAELTLGGARSNGQLIADFNGSQPRFALAGKLEELDAARASTMLLGQAALEGQSTVVAELSAQGGSSLDLIRTASGKVAISLPDGGKLGIDVKGLLGAAQASTLAGWSAATRGQTSFDRMDVKLKLQNGIIRSEKIEAISGSSTLSASGTVNLIANQLDLRLLVDGVTPPASAAAPMSKNNSLVLHGPWSAPVIAPLREEGVYGNPG